MIHVPASPRRFFVVLALAAVAGAFIYLVYQEIQDQAAGRNIYNHLRQGGYVFVLSYQGKT